MYLGTYLDKRAAICYEIKYLMQKFFIARRVYSYACATVQSRKTVPVPFQNIVHMTVVVVVVIVFRLLCPSCWSLVEVPLGGKIS